MAITLPEARYHLANSILFCGKSFNMAARDVALLRSAQRLMHEGGLNKGAVTKATTADEKAVDFSSNAGYSYYWNNGAPFIAADDASQPWKKLTPVSFENLRAEFDKGGSTTGRPELIHWVSETVAWLYPIPDAAYTIYQPVTTPAVTTTWTPGTHSVGPWAAGTTYAEGDVISYSTNAYRSLVKGNLANTPSGATDQYWELMGTTTAFPVPALASSVTFNIPDLWAFDWLGTGAVAALLRHAPGVAKQVADAERNFEALIERVSDAVSVSEGAYYVDPGASYDSSYGPLGLGGDL